MDKQQMKEAKWGAYKTKLVAELESLSREDWTVVYTDGSAKVVRGWAQAGYGAWYGPGSQRNKSDFVPLGEKQSVSRAGGAHDCSVRFGVCLQRDHAVVQ